VSDWEKLVSSALLGTERREPPDLADPGIAALVADGGAEERLLTLAGAMAISRRAGRLAVPAPALPEPAPAETLPACGPAASQRLALILDDRRALLPEWLRAAARRGLRAPAEWLPDLLDAATATPALQPDVDAVLGERGRWLAAQAPRWGWAAPLPATEEERERTWATGERPQRRRLFALLRREQPARARELLADGWAREDADDRAWLIEVLGVDLALEDEALLERALDDRRQPVRTAAARLLSRLPRSAFARRMRDRTLPLVQVEDNGLATALPDALDESMIRDGIGRTPPRGVGERAWWLIQLVSLTPLAVCDEIGLTPERAATLGHTELRRGLVLAAAAQQDPRWASFLAHETLERLRDGETELAERLPAPWPRDLSEAALELLVELVHGGLDWRRRRLIAERLDPGLADEAATRLEGEDAILTLLTFRRNMHEELR
jgi:hypothetical protein